MKKLKFILGILSAILFCVACSKEKDTPIELPSVITNDILDFDYKSALAGGDVTSDGGSPVIIKGVCWNTTGNPTTGDNYTACGTGTGTFTCDLTGLSYNTIIYVRAFAYNETGFSYGNEVSFKTSTIPEINFNPDLDYGSVNDVDGNTYKTIQIGTQTWMAENLKTTKYNDGTIIPPPFVENDSCEPRPPGTPPWDYPDCEYYITTCTCCSYDNDTGAYKAIYGALYNWHTVNTGKLCPSGWHIPSVTEWATLIDYLGGDDIAGGKLKEAGTIHWDGLNAGATNETGFTALPGGGSYVWDFSAEYNGEGSSGHWWSSTNIDDYGAYCYNMTYNENIVYREDRRDEGLSVRCVKDQ